MANLKNNVGLKHQVKISRIIAGITFLCIAATGFAQTDSTRRDTDKPMNKPKRPRQFHAQRAVVFRFNYTMCIPKADLGKRFGAFSNLGLGCGMKFQSGWDIRAEGSLLFSRNVLENTMLDSLRSDDGYLVDKDGYNFNPQLTMRGYTLSAHVGRLFPLGKNRNSGIFISVGGGFIQHKINFQNVSSFAPQVQGDNVKGYDRLTNGYYTTEFIGYQYMAPNRLVNFYAGFEFLQGSTKYARNWNYDLMGPDSRTRSDNYWGVRIGWILPIYGSYKGQDEFIFR